MTEDSGAFKTNSANSGPIPAFVTACGPCGQRAAPPGKRIFGTADGVRGVDFNKRAQAVAVFSNVPDSRARMLCAASRTRPSIVVTAFPMAQGPLQDIQ
jgi:hypothetical protein